MNKKRLLTRKERAYIIGKISGMNTYQETFKNKLTRKEEDKLVLSIIGKIQAPQDFEK